MNKIYLIGRLTKEPEIRYTTTDNIPVATFTLAVNREQKEDGADFINIVVWNKQAENVHKYLHKGSQCAIDGRLQIRNYDDDNGKRHYITEVIAHRVEFLDTKQKDESSQTQYTNETFENYGHTVEEQMNEQQYMNIVDDFGMPIL